MVTVVVQAATTWLILAFGILSLLAARSTPAAREPHRSAWKLTGITFTLVGFLAVLHTAWAAHAFLSGPGSPAWTRYLDWASTVNYGRGLAMITFSLGLAGLAIASEASRLRTVWFAVGSLVVGLLVGATYGYAQGSFLPNTQFLSLTMVNLATLLVLIVGLLLHLSRDSMDRLLWVCLCLYAIRLAGGALWMVTRSWFGVQGVTLPPVVEHFALAIACYLLMIAVALTYIAHRRRNRHVPSLLEHLRPMRVRSM